MMKRTTTPAESDPMSEATDNLEAKRSALAQLEDDIIAGVPHGPDALANAESAVRHAELLVERARRQVEDDQRRSEDVAAWRARLADRAEALSVDPFDAAVEVESQLVTTLRRNSEALANHTAEVAAMPGEVDRLGRLGGNADADVGVSRWQPEEAFRVDGRIVVATPPKAIAASAFLGYLEGEKLADPTFEIDPKLRAALVAMSAPWERAKARKAKGTLDV